MATNVEGKAFVSKQNKPFAKNYPPSSFRNQELYIT